MSDEVREKLVALVKRFGNGLASDPRLCRALLSDVCGVIYKREISILVAAVEVRAASELSADHGHVPKEVVFSRLAARMHSDLGIAEDFALWSIESWAIALRVIDSTFLKLNTNSGASRASAPPTNAPTLTTPGENNGVHRLNEDQVIAVFKNIGWFYYHPMFDISQLHEDTLLPFSIPLGTSDLPLLLAPSMPNAGKPYPKKGPISLSKTNLATLDIPEEFISDVTGFNIDSRRVGRSFFRKIKMFFSPIHLRSGGLKMEWHQIGKPTDKKAIEDFLLNYGIDLNLVKLIISRLALRVVQPTELKIWETSRTGSSIKLPPRSIWGVGSTFRDCLDGPEMVVLPRGEFSMGSADDDEDRTTDEGPRHKVKIDYELAVGKYPITFEQWGACLKDGGTKYSPWDKGWGRGNRPVINISWDDIQLYLRWLGKVTGKSYRLLSEAEWEYATRGGSEAPYSFGGNAKELGRYAWFDENSSGKSHPVGEKLPNPFDLYDMHGNVWEWTQDCWNDNYHGAPTDGSAWMTGDCSRRVVRGGSWGGNPQGLRSAYRFRFATAFRNYYYGFRVARTD